MDTIGGPPLSCAQQSPGASYQDRLRENTDKDVEAYIPYIPWNNSPI
jgi:hypothetical protein